MGNAIEDLLQSIDLVSSYKTKEISYDKTEVCEIISELATGKYWVSNGSAKYEAYVQEDEVSSLIIKNRQLMAEAQEKLNKSDYETPEDYMADLNKITNFYLEQESYLFDLLNKSKYKIGDSVYVLIPSGNYENKKTITGKYVLDTMKKYNPFQNSQKKKLISINPIILQAYREGKDEIDEQQNYELITLENSVQNDVLKNLGVSFSLQTNFGEKVYQGDFEITFSIYGYGTENLLAKRTITNKDLYGNIYNLTAPLNFQFIINFNQEKEIEELKNIKYYQVEAKTSSNFNYEGEEVKEIAINNIILYYL